MWNNYQATKIQNYYKKFLKCDRDSNIINKLKILTADKKRKFKYIDVHPPIDPIYRTPYEEKNHLRLVEWFDKRPVVWHFNIISLIDWLNIAKVWTNPMTNCLFLNKSIDKIMEFIDKNSIKKKIRIKIVYNKSEPSFKKKIVTQPSYVSGAIYLDLLVKSITENNDDDCFNLLNNNYDKIATDYFKIDQNIDKSIIVNNETINQIGALHYAISLKNKNIVHHLLYYGCNFEKKIGVAGYSPIHLAAILNLPEIGSLLKMYGANLEEECLYNGITASIFEICNELGHNDFIMKLIS